MSMKRAMWSLVLHVGEALNRFLVRPFLGPAGDSEESATEVTETLLTEEKQRDRSTKPSGNTIRQGFENQDVSPKAMLILALVVIGVAIVMHGSIAYFLFALKSHARALRGPDLPIPDAAETFPLPRLERNPAANMARLRATEEESLHQYGWINRSAGIVRLPIERAMELTASRGVPVGRPNPSGALANPFERASIQQASSTLAIGSQDYYGR